MQLFKDDKSCTCDPSQQKDMAKAGWSTKAPEVKAEVKAEVEAEAEVKVKPAAKPAASAKK